MTTTSSSPKKIAPTTYLNKLFKSALDAERVKGNPVGLCAIQQVKQQVSQYNLQSAPGRRAAVNAIEALGTQKGCNVCDIVGAGTIELRSRWGIKNPAPVQTRAQMDAELQKRGIRIINASNRGKA